MQQPEQCLQYTLRGVRSRLDSSPRRFRAVPWLRARCSGAVKLAMPRCHSRRGDIVELASGTAGVETWVAMQMSLGALPLCFATLSAAGCSRARCSTRRAPMKQSRRLATSGEVLEASIRSGRMHTPRGVVGGMRSEMVSRSASPCAGRARGLGGKAQIGE